MKIDLHTHSKISDGEDTPTALVMKAHRVGLDVIALTDHDTFAGVAEAKEAGKRVGVKVICGIELSAAKDGESVHLLGYGCDPNRRGLGSELVRIREGRARRLPQMVQQLNDVGLEITIDDVRAAAKGSPAIGRPHVADALIARGYVANRDEAFAKWLERDKPGYVERYAVPLERGIELIHDAKGVAVLAHPWGRGNRNLLPAPYIEQLTREHGLDGIEVDHQDHDEHTRSLLMEMGARMGLVRTGSSDYHGIGRPNNPLGVNTTRPSAFRELMSRIRLRGGQA